MIEQTLTTTADELAALLAEHSVTMQEADGPNAAHLTHPMLVDSGGQTFLVTPPGADAGSVLEVARPLLVRRAQLPVAVWETARLDHDVPMVFRRFGERLRVAYDPDQITIERARGLLALFHEYRETADSRSDPWVGATPEQLRARAGINRIIDESDDPPAAAERVLDLLLQEQVQPSATWNGVQR